ncbi:KamA family radical SAM protein [Geomobilimonas luticola]|uniref:KamA family radical SAM protein n=1 Tax=Geomobilimonas luticola TaxID=1114878 RepID=A0ABS5SFK3_9BACT|nr:KamA family radical SAM protein [Geomobilimonas luticola]MBT0654133.1 KamA family radical SAM protein [Geomobilimonas luticola]
MDAWQKQLAAAITEPGEISARFGVDVEPLREVVARYPLRITPHYLSLIEAPGDPIWRQCIPDPQELSDHRQAPDPLNEEGLSPVPGLIHRYPDRVVLLVSNACAVYCRFCMRKRQVGCGSRNTNRAAALDYIAKTPAIRDVILSGGDPLLLSDDELADILSRLRTIPHVEMIRIGSRVPVTLPSRITSRLCRLLKRFHPLYLNTHFNHPRELTPHAAAACGRLADAGIPLGNQTVLLKGVNDDPAVMKRLMQGLLAIRVRPYYIHQLDLVRGTGHFRTGVRRGLEIMEGLRGYTSGLATPYYVIDLPGGKGKVPLLPDNGEWRGNRLLLRNYHGECIEYEDLG